MLVMFLMLMMAVHHGGAAHSRRRPARHHAIVGLGNWRRVVAWLSWVGGLNIKFLFYILQKIHAIRICLLEV